MKSNFFKILLDYSKAKGYLVVFFIEPITSHLLNLIEDDEFNVVSLKATINVFTAGNFSILKILLIVLLNSKHCQDRLAFPKPLHLQS